MVSVNAKGGTKVLRISAICFCELFEDKPPFARSTSCSVAPHTHTPPQASNTGEYLSLTNVGGWGGLNWFVHNL